MRITLEQIKAQHQFSVIELLKGEEAVKKGKCSQWARRKELKKDKDLIYIQLRAVYRGEGSKSLSYVQFYLEDTEGYFSNAMPPDDYLEKLVTPGESIEGGILFALYRDISPSRLWYDTGIFYDNSRDPILIDIALPLPESETRTQFLAKEELAQAYSRQVATDTDITATYETARFIKEISHLCGVPYRKISNGYMLRIVLPEGRKQNVVLNFSGKDEQGNDLVTIGTICAPVKAKSHDRVFLKLNPQIAYGAVGISSIQGQDFYVISQSYPSNCINKQVIQYAIQNIAAKGDWLEKELTGGLDIQ